jgi:hypothetical protein
MDDVFEFDEETDDPEPAALDHPLTSLEEIPRLFRAGYSPAEVAGLCGITYSQAQKRLHALGDAVTPLSRGNRRRGTDGRVYPHRRYHRTIPNADPLLARVISQVRTKPEVRCQFARTFRNQGLSLRQIAVILCVSHTQVARDLKTSPGTRE